MTTIHDLLSEMETWCSFTEVEKQKALQSKINTRNNPRFKVLVNGWLNGMYDEYPEGVRSEIISLLLTKK